MCGVYFNLFLIDNDVKTWEIERICKEVEEHTRKDGIFFEASDVGEVSVS